MMMRREHVVPGPVAVILCLALLAAAGGIFPAVAQASPACAQTSPAGAQTGRPGAANGWTMVWHDEFEGPNGSAPDSEWWDYNIGGDGWGNDELQYYTDSRKNSYLYNGYLVIKAIKESHGGCEYTSARLVTDGNIAWNGGRIEVRAFLPHGQGIWPAIWLLPQEDTYGDWRKNGEIDMMEMIGSEPDWIYGSMHYFANGDIHSEVNEFEPCDVSPAVKAHVFAIEWDSSSINWFVDDRKVASENLQQQFPDPAYKPFEQDFYLVLNVAVGGTWPGDPDAATVFPQKMMVDYVRVYEK